MSHNRVFSWCYLQTRSDTHSSVNLGHRRTNSTQPHSEGFSLQVEYSFFFHHILSYDYIATFVKD